MRQLARTGLLVAAATTGMFAAAAGIAHADADADAVAAGSPGVLSGNVIQVPIHVPVNVCGNTINAVGLLNPSAGNTCANISGKERHEPPHHTTGGTTGHNNTGGTTGHNNTTGGTTGANQGNTTGNNRPTMNTLPRTGSEATVLAPIGAAMLAGGFLLYRRTRVES